MRRECLVWCVVWWGWVWFYVVQAGCLRLLQIAGRARQQDSSLQVKYGRMAGWQDGRMAGWQDGRMTG